MSPDGASNVMTQLLKAEVPVLVTTNWKSNPPLHWTGYVTVARHEYAPVSFAGADAFADTAAKADEGANASPSPMASDAAKNARFRLPRVRIRVLPYPLSTAP